MNVKLIACDIDGTLLDDKKNISKEMLDTINLLKSYNIIFVLITGRNDIYVRGLAKNIGVIAPIVACNGALIREVLSKKIIYKQFLNERKVRNIIEYCLKNKYDFTLSSCDIMYCAYYSRRVNIFYEYNKHIQNNEDKILIKKVYSVDDIDIKKIFKIFLWQLSKEQEKEFCNIFNDKNICIVSSEKGGIDITSKDINKGSAVKFLVNYYGLSLDDVAVFGDNYNDISMLKLTKNSFAMGNAEEKVKKVANFIIDTNNKNGVAKAIKKYILGK